MKKITYSLLFSVILCSADAQLITTIAGNGVAGYSGDGGQATAAEIKPPTGIGYDASGNIYIADPGNYRIRKVSSSGIITTFAGNGTMGYSGDGGQATAAKINLPKGITSDVYGNIYFTDAGSNVIRKVSTTGVISTFAGNGTGGYSGDGGQATAAELLVPNEITFDGFNNAYIADANNNRIRKINTSGIITSIAGNGTAGYSGDGAQASAAELNGPVDVYVDGFRNIYIADRSNYRIRKINTSGIISTFAGNGVAGYSGDGGAATAAELNTANGVRADNMGNVYIGDFTNNRIRKVSPAHIISTFAGNGTGAYSGDGGQATAAELDNPSMLIFDKYGNLYFDDHANNRIRVVYLSLSVSTTVTNVSCHGESNGSAAAMASQGTTPYTYYWHGGATNSTETGLTAGTYTITVTDNDGITGKAKVTITQPAALPTPSITPLSTDSIGFRIVSPVDTLIYSWTLTDMSGTYSGAGDTAYMPVWPRNAILTYYNNSIAGCIASDSIRITHSAPLPTYGSTCPRWSKRGVWLEFAPHYYTPFGTGGNIGAADSLVENGMPFVNWCKNNHITYVMMDGVDYLTSGQYANSCGVFYQDSSNYDTTNARYLENFIDSLKTRGGVEQVGIECYPGDTGYQGYPDSNSYSVKVFNCANISSGISNHNLGLPWEKKIDILNLDDEFWLADIPTLEFHQLHMPMLRTMYEAAHECDTGFLRVEDYLAEPTNPFNIGSFTINDPIDTMEADSIALYADRILNSCYSVYNIALWNEADFRLAYPNFGDHKNKNMEIWPIFSAENYNHLYNSTSSSDCQVFWYDTGNNFSGTTLCYYTKLDTADWIEAQYYDSLSTSFQKKIFSDNNNGSYGQDPMGADTNFRILGNMWYDYAALKAENINFDTLKTGTHKGYLRFYVTLPHDTQYIRANDLHQPAIPVSATVHGGKGPFTYTWYNLKTGNPLLYGVGSAYQSYTDAFNYNTNNYNTLQLGVIVKNAAGDSAVTDYMDIYQICQQIHYHSPFKKNPPLATTVPDMNSVKVFPNPNSGEFTVSCHAELVSASQTKIEVYNVPGDKVLDETLKQVQGDNTINMNTQPNGMYYYRVLTEKGKLIGSGKLIIEK